LISELAAGPGVPFSRPRACGKFIFTGEKKLYVRGTTYGTFRPDDEGNEYRLTVVEQDFARMVENGINAVRTYNVPPRWFLDTAWKFGLYVMIGLPWEQHVTFLDDKNQIRSIAKRVRAGVRACAGHPAVLCYAVGNEIPSGIARWHGRRPIESFIRRLYDIAKAEDPESLVTYVNYPSTEYLELSFLDLVCFNVYLESRRKLEKYVAHLQNIAGERPLVMTEIGLDSRRHGLDNQARILDWQVRTAFASGCAGLFLFSWTDEWYRGGHDIEDWDFGLTTRDRQAKPALAAVREAFNQTPFSRDASWPKVSIVVCTCNGAHTIRDCLNSLSELDYPNYDVIVVNDGSTDSTRAIVEEYGFRVINTENRGLSNARNTGLESATGEFIAYLDDDTYADPHWLKYLAAAFLKTNHAAIGGPNIAPPGDGPIADCVANSPGGPVHVLLTDRKAEHIPGCNMAFRKSALVEIGGFDPRFRAAGDDVDICWRLQQRGWTVGFSHAATVWHHRRNSVRAYWRQQVGYGRAESLLEEKWPEKYNAAGHLAWAGRLYGKGLVRALVPIRNRIYHGKWGGALFQSVYEPGSSDLWSITLMPEWYLVIGALALLSALGVVWTPLLATLSLLAIALAGPLSQSAIGAAKASFRSTTTAHWKLYLMAAFLHTIQPLARLSGRFRHGLTPLRRRGAAGFTFPWPRTLSIWDEHWRTSDQRLKQLEGVLHELGAVVRHGGDFDRWDLEVRGGILGSARTLMTVEEHGGGKQLVRFRLWPRFSCITLGVVFSSVTVSALAAVEHARTASFCLGAAALLSTLFLFEECARPTTALQKAVTFIKRAVESQAGSIPISQSKDPPLDLTTATSAGPPELLVFEMMNPELRSNNQADSAKRGV